MFTGAGGLGKTTLAGWFARRLLETSPHARVLALRAPFDLETVYQTVRQMAFDGGEAPDLRDGLNLAADLKARLRLSWLSLAQRERPLLVILDNLESIQELETLATRPQQRDSLWLLQTVCALPAPTRVLLTGRYAMRDLPAGVAVAPVLEAPLGDILRRMRRLEWPAAMETRQKRRMYRALGGNHRAIEWAAGLLRGERVRAAELLASLDRLAAPPGTPREVTAVVAEAMRQNLLLGQLLEQLTPSQKHLLRAASHYRVPVNADGLAILVDDAQRLAGDRQRLAELALLEESFQPVAALPYLSVPPVARETLKQHLRNAREIQRLHRAMGRYHRHQGAHLTRALADDLEAIYHFRLAGDHDAADHLAERVCDFYYRGCGYADAKTLAEEIVRRGERVAWWALNRLGMCQQALGFIDEALASYKRALTMVDNKEDEAATLNNISQIFKARGEYGRALDLEGSLAIQREIGDRAGLIPTLHNMAKIALQTKDSQRAVSYWSEALQLARETRQAMGLFHVGRDFGDFLAQAGRVEEGKQLLSMALEVGRSSGLPGTRDIEAILKRIEDTSR